MDIQIQRVYRDRRLTAEEAAQNDAVRKAVMEEFPPLVKSAPSLSVFGEFLRQALRDSNLPLESIASDAGISVTLLAEFLAGKRDIHLTTADKLANAIGLEVATSE